MRETGSTVMIWAYIMDALKEQSILCKQNRNSGNDVADKLCFGINSGYYYATIYNETLKFDVEVIEGWNLLAFQVLQDSSATYTRLRIIAYTKSKMSAGYKTFSYQFYDNVEYDLLLGGKYANDGINITKGFVGYMLEIRLYSSILLTLTNLDDQVDWDCTSSTRKLCEFCPLWISPLNVCLEDYYTSKKNSNYLLAAYDFNSNVNGFGRKSYTSSYNSRTFLMYFGSAFPNPRIEAAEPHRSEANGLYFDGGDYIYGSIDATQNNIMTFNKYFTVEMWCRFTESNITQNYVLFEKIDTFGTDKTYFSFYFDKSYSFIIEMNNTKIVSIPDAYNNLTFPQSWVYIGVNFAALYSPKDKNSNVSKSCAYIWGPNNFEKQGCGLINDYYGETWSRPYYYDTRLGKGLIGFIKSIYFWSTYKSQTNMYYTPLRNLPRKDRCSPFSQQMQPACSACDQYLASKTCYSSCETDTYASTYNYCLTKNCTNDLCKVCYYDTSALNNNYCTACIDNANIVDGLVGQCKCKDGYYYNSTSISCIKCHANCLTCTGPGDNRCIKCVQGRPLWKTRCLDNCGVVEFPFNTTNVYNAESNTCVSCPDFYYTINSIDCVAQPYPIRLTNYANNYMILEFTQPVKYSGALLNKIFSISIAGPKAPYDFEWSAPFWEGGSYQQNVFIELKIYQKTYGTEQLFLYMEHIYISDIRGYQLLKRNSTSQSEFIPLKVDLIERDYISASDRSLIGAAGNSVIISMLITVGVNAIINLLSSGSMELIFTFLNVVQIMNYIPIMSLQFPSIMYLMFGYLGIANSDISLLADAYYTTFNLNELTFKNDTSLSSNFAQVGYGSMKIVMNLSSQSAIICGFLVMFPLLLTLKNLLKRCCNRGHHFFESFEQGFKYNGLIRFYLEGFLEINTAAYVNLMHLEFDSTINLFCSVLSIIIVCVSLVFPIASGFFLYQNHHKLHEDKTLASKYGSLYEEYHTHYWYQYMFQVFFVLRRLGFIIMLVFLRENPLAQLIVFQILNFFAIMTFIMMRPYRHNLLNTFSIINESVLFIIGFYLFMFLDQTQQESNLRFYGKDIWDNILAWIVIGLVCLMVVFNLMFIFPYKIRETYLQCKEKARIKRLHHINQVEQKFQNFDYKKFFMSSFKYRQQIEIGKKQKSIPNFFTQISDTDSKDRIPPEPYSANIPLNFDKSENPIDTISENMNALPDQYESPRSAIDVNDKIDPLPYFKDKMPSEKDLRTSQMPGFDWLDQLHPNIQDSDDQEELKQPNDHYLMEPGFYQPHPGYPMDNFSPTSKKKSVTFQDPNDGGFFNDMMNRSIKESEEDLFQRDPLQDTSMQPEDNPLW